MQPATTSAQALAQLQQSQANAKTPQQLSDSANAQYGIPQAQQTVTGLRSAIQNTTNLLSQVAPGVMGRTGNSLVTSAQANRIIQNEQAPISTTLEKQNADYGNAESDYKDSLSKAENLAQLQGQGQTQQQSYLQQLYSDLYGQEQDAYTKQRQAQLDAQAATSTSKSSGGGGGGGGSRGGGSSSSGSSNAAPSYNNSSVQDWVNSIHQNFKGQSWGAIAKAIESQYGKIPTGSNADQALHYIFTGVY